MKRKGQLVVFFGILFVGYSLESPIPLQNGQYYSSPLKSGQTIEFAYNITDPCADLLIESTGDGDLYVSRIDRQPNVFGYSTYSFDCGGDTVSIKHDSQNYEPAIYFIR